MSRPFRITYEGAVYHVMNRGLSRQKVFLDKQCYQKFIRILQDTIEMWDVQIHAVSLLPNHYHLLIETPRANISRAMRHIGAVYTQWFNHKTNRDGPLFRGRYKAILVEEDAYLVELLRYIHLNPVKANLVTSSEEHPWTSHRAYLKSLNSWQWLTTERLLSYFGKRTTSSRKELNRFVQSGVPKSLEKRLSSSNWPSVFSTKSFEALIEWNFVKDLQNKAVQYRPMRTKTLNIKKTKKTICEVLDYSWQDIVSPKTRKDQQHRYMAIAAIQRTNRQEFKALSILFEGIIPSTITKACKKAPEINPELWEYLMVSLRSEKS
jgi:putative transposase